MARKPKSEAGRLAAVIACRLTAAENTAYKAQVEASGFSSGEYLRKLIVERPVQILARPKSSVDKGRLVYLYNKTSNNMNQIAHQLHIAHLANQTSASVYEKVLSELIAMGAYLRGQIDRVD